jgi:hypothetical protein
VLVTIVVDQLAAWIAAERLPLLPADGGFARLRREGTWARDVRYAHSATETAPGHAALYSGLSPRVSGIYTNELPGPDGEGVALVRDDSTRLVDAGGVTERPGVSLARLRGATVADRLREAHPEAVIVSLSLKDRGAVFGGGRRPDAALWFDHDHDALVTSTAFARALPLWARPAATPEALSRRRATPWRPLDPALLAARSALADDASGEGDYLGLGIAFPHDASRTSKPPRAFRATPAADELIFELAIAALDAERRPDRPLLLALSLSAHDYVGHVFGPHSWESWDELLRLDAMLAALFTALDHRVGDEGWSVLLGADHGAVPMPELPAAQRDWCAAPGGDRWERPCAGGGRVNEKRLHTAVVEAAHAALGEGSWIRGLDDVLVFLGDQAIDLPPARRARLDAAVRDRLLREPGVHEVVALRATAEPCSEDESVAALVCRSTRPEDGAGYYVVLAPGWAFETTMVPGRGTNHGSPWLYDRSVPLLVRAPGRVHPGVEIDEPLSYATFARTAAALLGLDGFAGAGADLTIAQGIQED